MNVKISFIGPYANITGQKTIELAVNSDKTSIREVLELLFENNDGIKKKLQEGKLHKSDIYKALFMVDKNLADVDTPLYGDTVVELLFPIAGG